MPCWTKRKNNFPHVVNSPEGFISLTFCIQPCYKPFTSLLLRHSMAMQRFFKQGERSDSKGDMAYFSIPVKLSLYHKHTFLNARIETEHLAMAAEEAALLKETLERDPLAVHDDLTHFFQRDYELILADILAEKPGSYCVASLAGTITWENEPQEVPPPQEVKPVPTREREAERWMFEGKITGEKVWLRVPVTFSMYVRGTTRLIDSMATEKRIALPKDEVSRFKTELQQNPMELYEELLHMLQQDYDAQYADIYQEGLGAYGVVRITGEITWETN